MVAMVWRGTLNISAREGPGENPDISSTLDTSTASCAETTASRPTARYSAVPAMLMMRFKLWLPSSISCLVRFVWKPELDIDANDNPGRLRSVAFCEKAWLPTGSS